MAAFVVAAVAVAAANAVLLLAGVGALSPMHRDVQQPAENLISHLHFNSAKICPRIVLDASAHVTHARRYLLAVVSGAIYIRFELAELSTATGITALALLALIVNVVVVGSMSATLVRAGPDHPTKQHPDRRL